MYCLHRIYFIWTHTLSTLNKCTTTAGTFCILLRCSNTIVDRFTVSAWGVISCWVNHICPTIKERALFYAINVSGMKKQLQNDTWFDDISDVPLLNAQMFYGWFFETLTSLITTHFTKALITAFTYSKGRTRHSHVFPNQ